MLKPSGLKRTISCVTFISITLCTLILMCMLLLFSTYTKAAEAHISTTGADPLATTTAAATGTASATVTAHAIMRHTPYGYIHMTYNANTKSLTLDPSLSGFKPNSTHVVQIEQGTCPAMGSSGESSFDEDNTSTQDNTSAEDSTSAEDNTAATATPGATATGTATQASPTAMPAVSLYSTMLTSDATGQIKSSATINHVNTPPTPNNMHVSVYNGSALKTAEQKVAIACGNIKSYQPKTSSATATATGTAPATGTATGTTGNTFTANMGPTNSPNEHSTGLARLSLTKGTLSVQFKAKGLAPNSTHAVRVYSGTCQNIGSVAYDLGTITADSEGKVDLSKTFKNVTSIPDNNLAAQVHYGTHLNDQVQNNPIMCGNIHLDKNQPSATATP
ncbi:hypothetical protein KDW_49140 [Dictyobacter vulcani]|uniref:CHRD domain-containing protein n=1 Tax=Dictyobacter vulcani TaxID=2607529 RepID=A0A5J4KU85_9CHLR|nr:hypothetical protein [Dictyobacter vulcani]GER90752.1 hypothetical protein KDW_49140 [Dictyobacter vulcani]